MRLRFLGTGTGGCKIKKTTSKEYRRQSCLLVDEVMLIDPTEDIFEFEDTFSLDGLLSTVRYVVLTHLDEGASTEAAIARLSKTRDLTLYATEGVHARLSPLSVRREVIAPETLYEIDGYRLIPLVAASASTVHGDPTLSLAICSDRALFWGVPGGIFRYECFAFLKELHLDVLVLDGGLADAPVSGMLYEHLNLDTARFLREVLLSTGTLTERSRVLLAGLPTDKKRKLHEELLASLENSPITLPYDGYFLTV